VYCYKFQRKDIFNVDETGCTTVQNSVQVVAPTGVKQVGAITGANDRGQLVTVCCTVSAVVSNRRCKKDTRTWKSRKKHPSLLKRCWWRRRRKKATWVKIYDLRKQLLINLVLCPYKNRVDSYNNLPSHLYQVVHHVTPSPISSAHNGRTLIVRDSAKQLNILFMIIVVEKYFECGCMTRRIGLGLLTICLV